jgi:hypothetical protein
MNQTQDASQKVELVLDGFTPGIRNVPCKSSLSLVEIWIFTSGIDETGINE